MKKTKISVLTLALCLTMQASAQNAGGGISASILHKIEAAQPSTSTDKALFNAIASNKIDNLAKNFANQGAFDTHFSV